jgi:CubicO group peptidase (beta-lactamase class C family)
MRKALLILLLSAIAATVPGQQKADSRTARQVGATARSVPPDSADDSFGGVRAFIQRQLIERNVPSVAVAVARDGRIIWEEAFGWADRENRVPATPHTIYSLASISKPITATGLMILKERGKIDLDRPINDYLGEAKLKVRVGNPAEATVRRVANHTSGLPLHYQFFYEDEPYRAPSRDETIRRYANSVTAPGEKYQYSNLGYGILDYLIERTSGKSYAEFMRAEVFQPLGLTRMSVDIGPGLEKHQAVRYGTDGLPIPFYAFDHPGGSAVYASAHDLLRFAMFHLKTHLADQKPILTDQTIDEMQRPTIETGPNAGYGIGWSTGLYPGNHRAVAHSGGMGGVATVLQLFPQDRIALVVLSNSSSPAPYLISEEIVATLMPDARRPAPQNQPFQEPVFKPSSELIGLWKGAVYTYKEEIPFTIEIKPDGDVHTRLGSQLRTLLNRVDFKDGYLTGQILSDIGTEDANRTRYILSVSLKLRGDVMNGAMTAQSLPAKRVGNALTQWVELKKQ